VGIINQQTVLEGQPLVLPACQCGILQILPGSMIFQGINFQFRGFSCKPGLKTPTEISHIYHYIIYIPIRIRKIRSRNYNPLNHPNQVDRTATKKTPTPSLGLCISDKVLGPKGSKSWLRVPRKWGHQENMGFP
jgi:hypothetical protein